jgi:hypothetical protein
MFLIELTTAILLLKLVFLNPQIGSWVYLIDKFVFHEKLIDSVLC